MSGCLQLLHEIDISELTQLELSGCKLNKADIVSVSHKQMSKLIVLELSENTLTNCLSHLFGEITSLASLGHLSFKHCGLSSEDVKVLGNAGLNGKLPNITHIDLSENILTNLTKDLLGVGEVSCFPNLHTLRMNNAKLSRDDIVYLSETLQAGYLPFLGDLHIVNSDLGEVKDVLEELIEVLYFMVKNKLFSHGEFCCLTLACSSLSKGFLINRWSERIGFWEEEIIWFGDGKLVCQSNKHHWSFSVHFNGDTEY